MHIEMFGNLVLVLLFLEYFVNPQYCIIVLLS